MLPGAFRAPSVRFRLTLLSGLALLHLRHGASIVTIANVLLVARLADALRRHVGLLVTTRRARTTAETVIVTATVSTARVIGIMTVIVVTAVIARAALSSGKDR
jgi:hypothetical protein